MKEQVMVVDKNILPLENGVITGEEKDSIYNCILSNFFYMPREEAEISAEHKQIIPYVVVTFNDKYLLFKRTPKQTEARLHDKYSLGVGGHINPPDNSGVDPVIQGLHREFREELTLENYSEPVYIGVINDDRDDVGKVHLGLLFAVEASTAKFQLPESEKMSAEWVEKETLADYYPHMETWSQLYFMAEVQY